MSGAMYGWNVLLRPHHCERSHVMSHAVRLRKVGRSVMLAIPEAILDTLDLSADATVALSIRSDDL